MYYCTMPVPDGGGGGGVGVGGAHEEAAVSVLKKNSHIYMYGNVLVVFGVFLGGVWGISRKKFNALYVR